MMLDGFNISACLADVTLTLVHCPFGVRRHSATSRFKIVLLYHTRPKLFFYEPEEWIKFLEVLEDQGVRGENGLKLIIHDGGKGLCSALQTVWFDAEQQRFHKLRNIAKPVFDTT
jgi:hypothetical protein